MKVTEKEIFEMIKETLLVELGEIEPMKEKVPRSTFPQEIAQLQQENIQLKAQIGVFNDVLTKINPLVPMVMMNPAAAEDENVQKALDALNNLEDNMQKAVKDAIADATSPLEEGCAGGIAPAAYTDEDPHQSHGEGTMAKSQLYKAAHYAQQLHNMIEDSEELDAWVQAKITKASDYLSSVKHHLEYRKLRGN